VEDLGDKKLSVSLCVFRAPLHVEYGGMV
jgi:hypothetical protein